MSNTFLQNAKQVPVAGSASAVLVVYITAKVKIRDDAAVLRAVPRDGVTTALIVISQPVLF